MGLSNPFPPGPNTDYWTVWAKRADGHMVSVSDTQSTPWTQWSDRGNLLGGPGAQGVSATSWVGPGATTEERAYYEVGNIVVEYSLTNRAFAGQRAIPGPAPTKNPTRNFTLTGYFAATHRYTPATGAHQPVVFATIKDNPGDAVAHLWALVISNPGPGQSYDWQQVSTGTTGPISPSWPVVASASGDRTIVRAFARTTHATPQVSMYRWSGAWRSLDLSNPNEVSQSPPNDDLPIPGAVGSNGNPQYVDVGPFRSIIASPTDPNRVYYAYQRREANQTNLDVSFQILTYNPNTDEFTASPAVSLTDVSGDLRDQFQPALTVSRQGTTTDTIFASWYDRRDDALACPVTPNRCYRPMRSVSIDGGLSFIFTQRLPVDGGDTLSDPALLPSRCTASPPPGSNPVPTYRFIGDYRHVSGDPLHSFHVAVGAPLGSGDPTGTLTRGWVSTGFWSW